MMKNHILVHEARLATLQKKRDFHRSRKFFNLLIKYVKVGNEYDKVAFEFELLSLSIPIQLHYFKELTKKFKHILMSSELDEDFTYVKNILIPKYKNGNGIDYIEISKELLFLIKKYEMKLYIFQQYHSTARRLVAHTGSDIYHIEHTKLREVLDQMITSLKYFDDELGKHTQLHGQQERQELDYLIKVVYFEIWNFLSHMSHALSDTFKNPLHYISDLEKASAHLRRAIMDIYDGMLVDIYYDKLTPEYLELRYKKIQSLGSYDSMNNLTLDLRDYYLRISQ